MTVTSVTKGRVVAGIPNVKKKHQLHCGRWRVKTTSYL